MQQFLYRSLITSLVHPLSALSSAGGYQIGWPIAHTKQTTHIFGFCFFLGLSLQAASSDSVQHYLQNGFREVLADRSGSPMPLVFVFELDDGFDGGVGAPKHALCTDNFQKFPSIEGSVGMCRVVFFMSFDFSEAFWLQLDHTSLLIIESFIE